MKINNKDLNRAYSLVKSKKYPQAIRFLEPKVPLFLEDELFYYLLGVSCFHTGDIGGSEFYFRRSLQVNHENCDSRLYLAAIKLKKKDEPGAARLWLNILDSKNPNKYAQRGLNSLKKVKDPSSLDHLINSKEIYSFVPPLKGIPPMVIKGSLILFLVSILVISAMISLPYIKREKNSREDMANLSLQNYIGPYVEFDGNFTYILTGEEIKSLFESAVDDFHNFKDNGLQMKINKLNLSNASKEIKGKISIVEKLIQKPTLLTMTEFYSFSEIIQDPMLYNNCFILWKGKVTNVSYDLNRITLDFLVGYENETVLEGFIFTIIPFEVLINESVPVEILGQIVHRNGKLVLSAISIRSLIE